MNTIVAFIRQHQLAAFFALVFALLLASLPLAVVVPALGPFMLVLLPALSAIIVSAVSNGRAGVRALLRRLGIWRIESTWYIIALGLPAVISLIAMRLAILLGSPVVERSSSAIFFLIPLLFVLAIGEEVGWRGFALPRLMENRSAFSASLILGAAWAIFHWPLLLPGQMLAAEGTSILTHSPTVIVLAILYTWIYQHTKGSVLMAVLFHGAFNTFNPIFLGRVDQSIGAWLSLALWGVTALVVVIVFGPNLGDKLTLQREFIHSEGPAI
jgi:membrane protease YdiL (CAAX protease family)